MTCRDMQYQLGQTYIHDGPAHLCECGFHACLLPSDIFRFYYPCEGALYTKVYLAKNGLDPMLESSNSKICGRVIHIDNKLITVEELMNEELLLIQAIKKVLRKRGVVIEQKWHYQEWHYIYWNLIFNWSCSSAECGTRLRYTNVSKILDIFSEAHELM